MILKLCEPNCGKTNEEVIFVKSRTEKQLNTYMLTILVP